MPGGPQQAEHDHVYYVSNVAVLPNTTRARVCTLCDHFEVFVPLRAEWVTVDEYQRTKSTRQSA